MLILFRGRGTRHFPRRFFLPRFIRFERCFAVRQLVFHKVVLSNHEIFPRLLLGSYHHRIL